METGDIYRLFGQRVAREREALGLKQSDLAGKVGLSRASIANIEAGRQRVLLHQAIAIGQALDAISMADLFSVDLIALSSDTPDEGKLEFSGSPLSKKEETQIAQIIASS